MIKASNFSRKREKDIRRWNETPCPLIDSITIVEMIILPKAVYRFEAILTQIPILFLTAEQRKLA